MEGILTRYMSIIRQYRPNPGMVCGIIIRGIGENGVNIEYNWFYSNYIICVLFFLRILLIRIAQRR